MDNNDLKKDLEKFVKGQIDPINKKMIEQEKRKHEAFMEKHFDKYDALSERQNSFRSQLITLEGVIFAAVVIFTNGQNVSVWLIAAITLILISIFFGIWAQDMFIASSYQSHEWNYVQAVRGNWWSRELWGDKTVKDEKALSEPELSKMEESYKKKITYKILKFLHLNADRIDNIFKLTFIIALFLLILHIFNSSLVQSTPMSKDYQMFNHHHYNSR